MPFSLPHNALQRRDDDDETEDGWCDVATIEDQFLWPREGKTWVRGQTQMVGWGAGRDVNGTWDEGSAKVKLELRWWTGTYGPGPDDLKPIVIFDNKTFDYPSSDWKLWNPNCTDTYMNYTWTIPMDLDVGDSKFTMTVYDVTNRSNIGMLQSSLFFISADNGTSTADSNTGTSTPESSQETTTSTGLATGAKAGIGAGIAVFALVLLLVGFFLYRRKKRQTPRTTPTDPDGFEKPELDAKSTGISEVDGTGISPHQAPDNAIYEAPGVLVHEAPTGKEQTVVEKMKAARQINEEPVEMPADSPMSSPKTSQDRLNRT
ncbi:uncharacterized protein FFB20_06987 [Fusarium fujikuroi]|nr:uncharacterized protein FFB20_06987 [Fusarium fujikuroi]SCO53595.1 uncharacterized protein FFNC_15037 [Fusarium fujikuroi]VTT64785.1 unnamed protein product [Fusarium fujikuroi]